MLEGLHMYAKEIKSGLSTDSCKNYSNLLCPYAKLLARINSLSWANKEPSKLDIKSTNL